MKSYPNLFRPPMMEFPGLAIQLRTGSDKLVSVALVSVNQLHCTELPDD